MQDLHYADREVVVMLDEGYVPLLVFNGQQVYFDLLGNKVVIQRKTGYLQEALPDERKQLIDAGLLTITNALLRGEYDTKKDCEGIEKRVIGIEKEE